MDKTLLIHATKLEYLPNILETKEIQPGCKVLGKKSARYTCTYMGVLFKFLKPVRSDIKKDTVYILFSDDILEKVAPKCWSDIWNFGKCEKKNSTQYDSSKTPSQNIALWSEKYRATHPRIRLYSPMSGNGQNEIVIPGSIPLTHCKIFKFETEKEIDDFYAFLGNFGYPV